MAAPPLKEVPRAKRALHPPHLSFPKHRPIVENGTFSTMGRCAEPEGNRLGRPCEAPPTQAACHEGGPGAGAPHGILAGPRQPLVPFPCGKELVRPQTHETLTKWHILSLVRRQLLCLPTENIPFAADRAAATLRRGAAVENGTFSTGPLRAEPKGTPSRAPLRGSTVPIGDAIFFVEPCIFLAAFLVTSKILETF